VSSFATIPGEGAVRVALVGAGNMGQHWMSVLDDSADVELVGLVDLDLNLARRVAAHRESLLVVGDSLRAVATESGAQAVIDVTVPAAHFAVNTEALLAGLPVLCEKPIAPTVSETLSLIATAELTGQLLMTSQSRRYYPALAELKDLVSTLGDIGIVSTEFFRAPHFGGFRDEMAQPLLIDMAIHTFDVSRYLLDSNPVRVDCRTFNPSWSWYQGDSAASALFEFETGTKYQYTGSWCSPGVETSWNGSWRVSGSRGSAIWDGEGDPKAEYAEPPSRNASRVHEVRVEIAGALDEFVHALRSGVTPSGEVHSNVHSVAMVEAAVLSAGRGRTVEISDVMDAAYRAAVESERRADVREVLESWVSASAWLKSHRGEREEAIA
jgi:predicted dehydrogenase